MCDQQEMSFEVSKRNKSAMSCLKLIERKILTFADDRIVQGKHCFLESHRSLSVLLKTNSFVNSLASLAKRETQSYHTSQNRFGIESKNNEISTLHGL